jgi:hypothetical protein
LKELHALNSLRHVTMLQNQQSQKYLL